MGVYKTHKKSNKNSQYQGQFIDFFCFITHTKKNRKWRIILYRKPLYAALNYHLSIFIRLPLNHTNNLYRIKKKSLFMILEKIGLIFSAELQFWNIKKISHTKIYKTPIANSLFLMKNYFYYYNLWILGITSWNTIQYILWNNAQIDIPKKPTKIHF